MHTWGGYAEYVKAPADNTTLIPDGLDFPVACVVARHAPTAFHLLRDRAKLKEGEWVLVMGAAGGLGSAGVQAAKYLGRQSRSRRPAPTSACRSAWSSAPMPA